MDGVPDATAPTATAWTHKASRNESEHLLGEHFAEGSRRCGVVADPGIVPVRSPISP